MPEFRANGRDGALDGLRGLSALAIIAWHFSPSIAHLQSGTFLGYFNKVLSLCWMGVDVFFVLSGYLIGATLLRERTSPQYFLVFYTRRALRILPLYSLVLFVFFSGRLLEFGRHLIATKEIWNLHGVPDWSYLAFAQNFYMPGADHLGSPVLGVTWSLAIEEQFYLLTPLLLFALPPTRLPYILGVCITLSTALRLWIGPGVAAYVLLPCRLDGLFLGVVLAYVLSISSATDMIARYRRALGIVTAVLFLVPALPLLRSGLGLNILKLPGGGVFHLWISCCAALLLALIRVSPPDSSLPRLLSLAPLRWAGLRAYGLYLLHPWALYLAFASFEVSNPILTGPESLPPLALALALTLVLAAVSWSWIESPCLRFARRFRY